jgi:hypothetical protein
MAGKKKNDSELDLESSLEKLELLVGKFGERRSQLRRFTERPLRPASPSRASANKRWLPRSKKCNCWLKKMAR